MTAPSPDASATDGTARFDVTAPLARRTLIEASAGTGKTYALCGLVTYLLGSGQADVDELLVVTFTNLATDDLKNRIRERVAGVRAALRAEYDHDDAEDEVVVALRDVEGTYERLSEALWDLGDLSVSTIHGYVQRALTTLGPAVGVDPDLPVVADDTVLIDDTIADQLAALAVRVATDEPSDQLPDPGAVGDIVKLLTNVPDLALRPDLAGVAYADAIDAVDSDASEAQGRIRAGWVAQRVVEAAHTRRERSAVRNYGDLLADLRAVVSGPHGEIARRQLRAKHRYVLIDEFQDTDRIQWDIFDRCFGTEDPGDQSRLVLVGDPKQAIYRFRGADVHVYAHVAGRSDVVRFRQAVNHRSDATLLTGLQTLLQGARFGTNAEFVEVDAAESHQGSRIRWDDTRAVDPVRITTAPEPASKSRHLESFVADTVAWIARLRERAEILEKRRDVEAWREVHYSDIAVLVRSGSQGLQLQRALAQKKIPAVVFADDDVRSDPKHQTHPSKQSAPSEAAWEWQVLIDAIANPSDSRRARAAAAGLFGPDLGNGDLLVSLEDHERIASFQQTLAAWSAALTRSGTPELIARLRNDTDWVTRAAGRADNGRLYTDIGHIGELLVALAGGGPTSPDRLLEALSVQLIDEQERDVPARRLETDAPAVTIMTVHKAKGLEFPIVGCLGLDDLWEVKQARFHEPGAGPNDPGTEVLDLTQTPTAMAAARCDDRDDGRRLLYVALTRARHHVFTYWGPIKGATGAGPFSRVLFGRSRAAADAPYELNPEAFAPPMGSPEVNAGAVPIADTAADTEPADPDSVIPDETARHEIIEDLTDRSRGNDGSPTLVFEELGGLTAESDDSTAVRNDRSTVGVDRLEEPDRVRPIDRRFRRWSYTGIAGAARALMHDEEHPVVPGADEGTGEPGDEPGTDRADTRADQLGTQPLIGLAKGPRFGTFVHAVLEQVDFGADDLTGELRATIDRQLTATPLDLLPDAAPGAAGAIGGREALIQGLIRAIATPLGIDGSELALQDLASTDRLDECGFDLRLEIVGGRITTGKRITEVLLDPIDGLPPDDPYRPWAEALRDGRFAIDLVGHLTGSVDLVFRVPETDGPTRYFVADYKTNALDSYTPSALVASMAHHDYPLQALLYSVALHRFLRWRLADYDPEVHLGGAAYLFLRGMNGAVARAGDPTGVAFWRIPSRIIERLDALFAGDAPTSPNGSASAHAGVRQ